MKLWIYIMMVFEWEQNDRFVLYMIDRFEEYDYQIL